MFTSKWLCIFLLTRKFVYNVNTNRIQRDVYFTSGDMQGQYNKRNSWIEVSDETIPKPKIRKWIKWFPKCSHSFVPSPISEQGGLNFQKMGKGATNFGGHFLILSYYRNWHCFIFSFLAIIVTDTAFAF